MEKMRTSLAGNSARGARQSQAGFTLLELVVVLSILALLAGLVLPGVGRWVDDWKLRGAAERVAQTIRYARTRALYEQRTYLVELDPSENRVRVLEPNSGFNREYNLPREIHWGEERDSSSSSVLRLILSPGGTVEERTLWLWNPRGTMMKVHMDFLVGGAGVEVARQAS
jgi:type II secretion system protein H